jgi:hypothetical protein
MERNENGFSALFRNEDGDGPRLNCRGERVETDAARSGCQDGLCGERQLAMAYSPFQCFRMLYSPDRALMRGTMFEELDKPLMEGM